MVRTFSLPKGQPLFDLASFACGGPNSSNRLSPWQVEQVRRTVQRQPEVLVKVLPRASNDLKAAARHLDYIGRHGELELEGDDGERLQGRIGDALLQDWDLDLDDVRRQSGPMGATTRTPPKLVHKLLFSMPPGTPADKVLGAVRNFAREQFALQHRYALVLHTDEPHPHVHLAMKAVSEQGVRLNIKKATLRQWRSEFARHLRLLGVPANATERAVRGQSWSSKRDGIYRAHQRGDSTYMRAQAMSAARDLLKGGIQESSGRTRLVETRKRVLRGWLRVVSALEHHRHNGLTAEIQRFVANMAPPRTTREWIAENLMEKGRSRSHEGRFSSVRAGRS